MSYNPVYEKPPSSQVVDGERYYSIPTADMGGGCEGCVGDFRRTGTRSGMCNKVGAAHGCFRVVWVDLRGYLEWRLK